MKSADLKEISNLKKRYGSLAEALQVVKGFGNLDTKELVEAMEQEKNYISRAIAQIYKNNGIEY